MMGIFTKPYIKPFAVPQVPLHEAVEYAIHKITEADCPVAVFMVAGKITCTKKTSDTFEVKTQELKNNLVGVYDLGADHRRLREDIATFYH